MHQTSMRAHKACRAAGVAALYYDVTGVGAGVRSDMQRMAPLPYSPRPVGFGDEVGGKDRRYTRHYTNGDFFARRNAQLAWGLRLRAQQTENLLSGREDVRLDDCLFINPAIEGIDDYMAELTQPLWADNNSGQKTIDKDPDDCAVAGPLRRNVPRVRL